MTDTRRTFTHSTAGTCSPRDARAPKFHPAWNVLDYDRARDLPLLIPMWPMEVADQTYEGHLRIIARLRRALREERRRGVAGDWAYDLRRHAGLSRALKAEVAALPVALTSWGAPLFNRGGA